MILCRACKAAISATSKFCNDCGAPVAAGDSTISVVPEARDPADESTLTTVPADRSTLTSLPSDPPRSAPTPTPIDVSSGVGRLKTTDPHGSRFMPGLMVAERYRIIGLLGKGGMGEVYRADDVKLAQPVALKFLPEALEQNPERLTRFLNEVRVARQVSHPNVCRVYDVGETDGRHYLSMEFVDGEDLASLLRRIGRLAPDKAVQLARQICAGLAAAHAKGIIHRDLKPANVMLDGRGQTSITDFGLAGLAAGFQGAEIRVGTPAYMSPEQLAGKEVTVLSDIYSLGLVLYELFTGKPAFEAQTLAEMTHKHQQTPPSLPSSLVDGLDPAVERVIMRCLEKDPPLRPGSALAVAAALPGGDPLAAALAAGETPSPEMVAAAGESEGLRPALGLTMLALVFAGLAGFIFLSDEATLINRVGLPNSPELLAAGARETLVQLGYDTPPGDRVHGFDNDNEYLRHVDQGEPTPTRWGDLPEVRPSPIRFWYREDPRSLVAMRGAGTPVYGNPPMTESGMTRLRLDPQGRLLEFLAVPPERVEAGEGATIVEPDWSVPFAAAGLDPTQFRSVTPQWNPLVDCDVRVAWEGTYAGREEDPIRIEAGGYGGLPVYFRVIAPWNEPTRMQPPQTSTRARVTNIVVLSIFALILIGSLLMAWNNMRKGRGDRRGAMRLAVYVFVMLMLVWALTTHHVASAAELLLLIRGIQASLWLSLVVWLLYMALEPYVRKLWPHVLISWTRLLTGRLRDPLVGRDILVGAVVGIGIDLLQRFGTLLPGWIGRPASQPEAGLAGVVSDIPNLLAVYLAVQIGATILPIGLLFLILILRVILKRQWAALGVAFLLVTALQILGNAQAPVDWIIAAVIWIAIMVVTVRLGLLAGFFSVYFANVVGSLPLTADLSAWYASRGWAMLLLMAALAVYGFWISKAGRPLFADPLLEET